MRTTLHPLRRRIIVENAHSFAFFFFSSSEDETCLSLFLCVPLSPQYTQLFVFSFIFVFFFLKMKQ